MSSGTGWSTMVGVETVIFPTGISAFRVRLEYGWAWLLLRRRGMSAVKVPW